MSKRRWFTSLSCGPLDYKTSRLENKKYTKSEGDLPACLPDLRITFTHPPPPHRQAHSQNTPENTHIVRKLLLTALNFQRSIYSQEHPYKSLFFIEYWIGIRDTAHLMFSFFLPIGGEGAGRLSDWGDSFGHFWSVEMGVREKKTSSHVFSPHLTLNPGSQTGD